MNRFQEPIYNRVIWVTMCEIYEQHTQGELAPVQETMLPAFSLNASYVPPAWKGSGVWSDKGLIKERRKACKLLKTQNNSTLSSLLKCTSWCVVCQQVCRVRRTLSQNNNFLLKYCIALIKTDDKLHISLNNYSGTKSFDWRGTSLIHSGLCFSNFIHLN